MCKKIIGISIAVFIFALLIPFSVYADDVDDLDVPDPVDVIITEVPAVETVEPEAVSVSDTEIIPVDSIASKAADDIISLLDDNNVVYVPELRDDLYLKLMIYIHDDNTEFVTEIIRSDIHDLIIDNSQPLTYSDDVKKSVDKLFDDMFAVTQDNQDVLFALYVIIGILSVILTLLFLNYFVR